MLEAQRIAKDPDAKAYDNLNDLFKELKAEWNALSIFYTQKKELSH